MALIRCPDCGREVSDAAATCPSCARPLAAATHVQTTKGATGKFLDPAENMRGCLRMVLVLFLLGLGGCAFMMLSHGHC